MQRNADFIKANRDLESPAAGRRRVDKQLEEVRLGLQDSQAQAVQLEKMGALGTLTAGIAHELNNPLMGMLNFVQYCLKHTARDNKTYPVLQDTIHEVKRCAEIVKNLLTFSRIENDDQARYRREDIGAIIERVLRIMSYRIVNEDVRVIGPISKKTPNISVMVSNLQHVFLSLICNALDAVKTSAIKELHITIDVDDELLSIMIADSGIGIAPESLTKIFNPFFTTKPAGQGTGLGLSVSRGIIEAHGGKLNCRSRQGKGTTFQIVLPIKRSDRAED